MRRTLLAAACSSIAAAAAVALLACSDDEGAAEDETIEADPAEPTALVTDGTQEIPADQAAATAHEAMLDREYPLHGLVTGLQLTVRKDPDPEASAVGWLRIGNRVRLKGPPTRTSTCNTGWYELYPKGFACAGQGIEIGDEPPAAEIVVGKPPGDAALPYQYFFVKDPMTPEYHRLPTRDEQRAALAVTERVTELNRADQERRAERVAAGDAPGEPQKPPVVHRYLDRGFYIASTGTETRAFRRFVRSVRGRYVKQSNLIERTGAELVGIELGEERSLPVAWMVRAARPMIKRDRADGTIRWLDDEELEPIERHTLLETWVERRNIGGHFMHVLEGDRYLRDWFVALAEPVERPREVGEDEPWVHVDLGTQTLVLYEGDTPTFATLVSSGQEGFETPTGLFTIRRKYIADTMSNVGDGQDDRYSIEDVPWTQYFSGSLALHGAFWHERFGLQRSHGCVNLAPRDARRVFEALWPRLPDGWLGITTEQTGFRASHVLITD
jgi:hypothetical protein